MKQETKIKEYIKQNYCDMYNIDNCINENITIDICENGDVIYDGNIIIKTNIK